MFTEKKNIERFCITEKSKHSKSKEEKRKTMVIDIF